MHALPGTRFLLLLLALALPLAVSLASSWWLSRAALRHDIDRLAEASARRAAAILDEGRRTLAELDQRIAGDCGASDIGALRLAGYGSLHYREAGLIREGAIRCTSFEVFDPPVAIPPDYLRRDPVYRDGRFALLQAQPTLLGGRSMIAAHYRGSGSGDYLNLLLDMDQFSESMSYFVAVRGFVFLVDDLRRAPEQLTGETPPANLDPRREGGGDSADGGLWTVHHAQPYPIAVAVYAPPAMVQERWAEQARPAALLGVALTFLSLSLVRRWWPRLADEALALRGAILRGEFVLHYQPVVDARSGRAHSAEGLLRWRHPQRGLLYPEAFLPAAERHGLLPALTAVGLRQIARDLDRLPARFRLAINVAPSLLADGHILRLVDECLGAGSPLDRLIVEITERELIEYADGAALRTVERLAARGACVALDDFGTGFSGLSHLRHLRPRQIKIDRSFVRAMDTEAVTAALVDGIVSMTASLGVELVGEGVETPWQRDHLLQRGIAAQQGWLYAKAMPIEGLVALLGLAEPLPATA
jgi:EAL domain-containing protein (putative c-di-GMP-specific phosphodiesterase class I)